MHQGLRKSFLDLPQTVFLRVVEDDVHVSIDTSGQGLHLRGYKPFSVEAPLRETLAAAIFYAGLKEPLPSVILDPMTGSGTFLFEALNFWQPNYTRKFAYENFPKSPGIPRIKDAPTAPYKGIGIDIEPKAIEAAKQNAELFFSKRSGKIEFLNMDFADFREDPDEPVMVLINPPYNARLPADRIALEEKIDLFLGRIKPAVTAIMWPGERFPWSSKQIIKTNNGGIPVTIGIF
jgi:putative N6-adenine-specific DNA methylase